MICVPVGFYRAKYISKWISSYNEQLPLSLWGITVQNEPEASQPWESCVYTAADQSSFVAQQLGPTLRADHPELKILAFDHNKDDLVIWADQMMGAQSASAPFVDGMAFHW